MTITTINSKAYTLVGTTDEVTGCDCCHRQNLKMTIVLQDQDGEYFFMGSTCGAKAQGWTVKDFNNAAKNADQQRKKDVRAALATHPLQAVIDAEMADTRHMRFTERREKGYIKRWAESTRQIQQEVAAQFNISVLRLQTKGY
jgi:hypothetical protein